MIKKYKIEIKTKTNKNNHFLYFRDNTIHFDNDANT